MSKDVRKKRKKKISDRRRAVTVLSIRLRGELLGTLAYAESLSFERDKNNTAY